MTHNKKGTILITSLWIMTILSILAAGIGFRVSIEARLSKYNMDRLKGLYLAKAGIFKCQSILARDSKPYDTIRECGISLAFDKRLQEVFVEKLGDGVFEIAYNKEGVQYYGMSDEERRININTATLPILQNLFGSEELASSIINWRSPASAVRVLKGASDDDYKALNPPYECKHAPFGCVEELLLVKGITPAVFESVKDYITIYGDGKVNINTAAKRTMLALGLSIGLVDIIGGVKNGPDKTPGTKDDGWFSGDIASQLGIPLDSPERTILGNYFTTASNYFRIESNGVASNSKVVSKIVCVVKRGVNKLEYYREY